MVLNWCLWKKKKSWNWNPGKSFSLQDVLENRHFLIASTGQFWGYFIYAF